MRTQAIWEYPTGYARWAQLEASWGEGPAELQPYLDRYAVGVLVLNAGSWPGIPGLEAQGWTIMAVENGFLIMVRDTPDNAAFICREAYRVLRPWWHTPVTPANAPQVLEEAERALHQCPDQVTLPGPIKPRPFAC